MSVFRKAQQSRPYGTPSGSCQPKLYYEHQGGDFPILDGRYGDKPTTIAPPVEDFHHAFAQFKAEYQDERTQPPEEFVRQIGEFMNAVSKIETDEIRRQATIRSLLSDLLSATFGQLVDSSRTSADHVLSYSRVREPLGALAIVEENAEHGTDGDGSVRGSFSYIQHWFDANQDVSALSYGQSTSHINSVMSGPGSGMLLSFIHHLPRGTSYRHMRRHLHGTRDCAPSNGSHLVCQQPGERRRARATRCACLLCPWKCACSAAVFLRSA